MFFWSNLLPKISHAQAVWTGRCVGTGKNIDVATIQGLECVFANVLSVITSLVGIVFFAMFLVGGFQYLRASGDPKAAGAASSTLTNSVIGLVGVIASWLILQMIARFTGVDQILDFKIPGGT